MFRLLSETAGGIGVLLLSLVLVSGGSALADDYEDEDPDGSLYYSACQDGGPGMTTCSSAVCQDNPGLP